MRNHFDHLAKELGQAALGPSGITVVNEPITAETQYADLRYEPDPARQAARDRLGLLGRIANKYACSRSTPGAQGLFSRPAQGLGSHRVA